MDNLNKTVSFILGLVVVLIFLAVITGRLNLKNKLPILGGKTVTPTPTKVLGTAIAASPTPVVTGTGTDQYHSYSKEQVKAPHTIPSTGSPTGLIILLLAGLGSGVVLRKLAKENN